MLLVLPIGQSDFKLAEITANLIATLGGVRPHGIMLAVSASCPTDSRIKIEKKLSGVTDQFFSHELTHKDERGWPHSANTVFSEVVRTVSENKGFGHKNWYFFEADNTPLVPGWATALDDEYKLAKMPYMGVKQVTHRGIGPLRREAGFHMVGTGIYPADMYFSCRLAKHLHILRDPFDVALQWEVVKQMHPTTQILHNWSTHKYVKEGKTSQITCQRVRNEGLPNSVPLENKFVVVHGCKDGSLAKLISGARK
jgi:hypothetical protein